MVVAEIQTSLQLTESKLLEFEDLYNLCMGKILAIRIPNYCDNNHCNKLTQELLKDIELEPEPDKKSRIYLSNSPSFWAVANNQTERKKYLNQAKLHTRKLREASFPYISPIDLIRLQIDEIWPCGAYLMHIDQQAMLFGLTRLWPIGYEALPHQDMFFRELPSNIKAKTQISQLGINIYLKTPDEGGELVLWDYAFSDEYCTKNNVSGSYGFKRSELPDSFLRIKPKDGDLIIINTFKVHAVNKVLSGTRVTLSGFIGYWGIDHPLKMWS